MSASLGVELSWLALVGALMGGAVLGLVLRRRPRAAPRRELAPAPGQELARLRAQLQELQARSHAQVEFFVNFPEVVRCLTAALTQAQVTSACSRAFTTLLHTRHVAILLAESPTHVRLVDGAGFPPEHRNQLSLGIGEVGLMDLLAGRAVASLGDHPAARQHLAARGLPAELAVPLCHGDEVLGLILVAQTGEDQHLARRLLVMLADLTAVALHAARLVGEIRRAAEQDALTGLANRRTLMARVQHELQRCASYGSRSSLAMIDVDHFKQYNDQNGHGAGDVLLRTLAGLLAGSTRRTDLVARYGGEEFTVILSGADRQQALQHAERIRGAVSGHAFAAGASQPLGHVSISVGVATFPDDATTVEALFKAADGALYEAKHGGRDCVVPCGAGTTPGAARQARR